MDSIDEVDQYFLDWKIISKQFNNRGCENIEKKECVGSRNKYRKI